MNIITVKISEPLNVIRHRISVETALGLLSLPSPALIVAGAVVRLRAHGEEQFDRDRMYLTVEYQKGDDTE